jgi:3-oxoacyl-[acyl-carrier protein] reductase
MRLDLEGKRVLVTGSTRGIGLAIAKAFLEEGADVALTGRDQAALDRVRAELAREFPRRSVLALEGDVTDRAALARLAQATAAAWGGLDVLVANVGSGKSVPDPLPDSEQLARMFQMNFDSAAATAREFYPLLQTARGNILFIASIAGVEATSAPAGYTAAKSALIAFAKHLSRQTAKDGVRVNCIAPGNIYFEGGTWAAKAQADPERVQQMIDTAVPLRRFGKPEEIAAAAVFLASERSSFTTGACLVVDGGQTVSFI